MSAARKYAGSCHQEEANRQLPAPALWVERGLCLDALGKPVEVGYTNAPAV